MHCRSLMAAGLNGAMSVRRVRRRRLPLAVEALLWRRGLAVAICLAAGVVITAAALGPLYARAAAESILRDGLLEAPSADTGLHLQLRAEGHDESLTSAQVALRLPQALRAHALRGYPERIETLEEPTVAAAEPIDALKTRLVWRAGACAHLRIAAGRCPTAAAEVMVSDRTVRFRQSGWRLGRVLAIDGRSYRIVGVYVPRSTDDPFWFGVDYFDAAVASEGPDTVDSVFTTRTGVAKLPDETLLRASLDYPLDVSAIRLADVPRLRADLTTLDRRYGDSGDIGLTTRLGTVLDSVDRQQRLVGRGTLLVTLQLCLLGWLVLFQVLLEAIESRSAEIALAKLRGQSTWQTIRFGLGPPVLLLAVAVPFGVAGAVAAARAFAATVLLPGTPVILTWQSLAAAGAAFVGGLLAVLVSARRVLTRPVLMQWRRTTERSGGGRASVALDAVLVVAAIGGLVALRAGSGAPARGGADLLAPGLLVLVVALVGTRLMPVVVAGTLPLTAGSRRLAVFLATRQVVRRPAGLRLAALLTVAVGLATFGIAGQAVGTGNRIARAQAELGASTVLTVQDETGHDPISITRHADPRARWAMAAATWLPDGGLSVLGTVLAVDGPRLAAVGDPARGGAPLDVLGRTIGSSNLPPLALHGTGVVARIRADGVRPSGAPQVRFDLVSDSGHLVEAESTPLRNGHHEYTAAIPCADGCRLAGITWDRPYAVTRSIGGSAVVEALSSTSGAGTTALDGRFGVRGAWRPARPNGTATDTVTPSASGVRDRFTSRDGGYGGIVYASSPQPIPAVASPAGVTTPGDGRGLRVEDGFDSEAAFAVRRTTPVLPVVLDQGVLMDVSALEDQLPDFASSARWQVWVGRHAPADRSARLRRAGLLVEDVHTEADRVALLGRQGPALSLLLLLATAIVGAVLAAGGTAISVGAASRRRSYEAAALQTVGVSSRQLYGAAFVEQLLLLGTAVLLGVPGGVLAATIALPVIPEFATPTRVQLVFTPPTAPLVAFTVVFVAVVLAVGAVAARSVLRSATAGRLREAEE